MEVKNKLSLQICKEHKTYVLTWRDPKQKNRNVYVTIPKKYKWCPTCNTVVNPYKEEENE